MTGINIKCDLSVFLSWGESRYCFLFFVRVLRYSLIFIEKSICFNDEFDRVNQNVSDNILNSKTSYSNIVKALRTTFFLLFSRKIKKENWKERHVFNILWCIGFMSIQIYYIIQKENSFSYSIRDNYFIKSLRSILVSCSIDLMKDNVLSLLISKELWSIGRTNEL